MRSRRTTQEWHSLISSAIESGQRISGWCQKNGIDKSVFYRYCKKLGYISGGNRTEKWKGCIAGSCFPAGKDVIPETSGPDGQALVPVPKQTIRAAFQENGNSLPLFPDPVSVQVPGVLPLVCIQKASFKVFVGDGFRKETLQSVLEVIANAQGS